MNRDPVIWMVIAAVFICGVVWGHIVPSEHFWSVTIADVFGGLSAIATAIAAYAAWRAASISKEQSEDSARQNRWQIYISHYEMFNKCLDGLENDFVVHFVKRNELYEMLFPTNRKTHVPFNPVGSDHILSWHKDYQTLEASSRVPRTPDDQEICTWLSGYCYLTGQMHFSCVSATDLQVFIGNCVPTGINLENFERALSDMADILERLSNFSYRDNAPQYNGMTWQCKNGIRSFIQAIESGANVRDTYRSSL